MMSKNLYFLMSTGCGSIAAEFLNLSIGTQGGALFGALGAFSFQVIDKGSISKKALLQSIITIATNFLLITTISWAFMNALSAPLTFQSALKLSAISTSLFGALASSILCIQAVAKAAIQLSYQAVQKLS